MYINALVPWYVKQSFSGFMCALLLEGGTASIYQSPSLSLSHLLACRGTASRFLSPPQQLAASFWSSFRGLSSTYLLLHFVLSYGAILCEYPALVSCILNPPVYYGMDLSQLLIFTHLVCSVHNSSNSWRTHFLDNYSHHHFCTATGSACVCPHFPSPAYRNYSVSPNFQYTVFFCWGTSCFIVCMTCSCFFLVHFPPQFSLWSLSHPSLFVWRSWCCFTASPAHLILLFALLWVLRLRKLCFYF